MSSFIQKISILDSVVDIVKAYFTPEKPLHKANLELENEGFY